MRVRLVVSGGDQFILEVCGAPPKFKPFELSALVRIGSVITHGFIASLSSHRGVHVRQRRLAYYATREGY